MADGLKFSSFDSITEKVFNLERKTWKEIRENLGIR